MSGFVMKPNTSVVKRTTTMVVVTIVALTGSDVTPEMVNCLNAKAIETAPLISPAHQIITWCLNVIDVLSACLFIRLDKEERGKMNAARPSNIKKTTVASIPKAVSKL